MNRLNDCYRHLDCSSPNQALPLPTLSTSLLSSAYMSHLYTSTPYAIRYLDEESFDPHALSPSLRTLLSRDFKISIWSSHKID